MKNGVSLRCKADNFSILLITGWLLSCVGLAFSQERQYTSISPIAGLPQRSVISMYQDPFGFMWIGTRDGLCRYDGYEFITYRHQVDEPNSISGNTIHAISGDREGNIWAATENGLSKYAIDNNSFSNYALPEESYESSAIQEVYVSRSGEVWAGCRYGLFKFNIRSKQFEKHTFTSDGKTYLNHGLVSAITEDANGVLWVGASRLGLFRYNPNTGQGDCVSRETDQERFPARIESIKLDSTNIWAGSYGSGLFLFNKDGNIISHWHKNASQKDRQLANNHIRDLAVDKHKNIWIGTFGGLYMINDNHSSKKVTLNDHPDAGILEPTSIRSLYKDHQDNIWVGTYFDGIKRFGKRDERFSIFLRGTTTARQAFGSNNVSAVYAKSNGEAIIGYEDGGFGTFDKSGTMSFYPRRDKAPIKAIYEDEDHNIWLGVFGKGLYQVSKDGNTEHFFPLPAQEELTKNKGAIINSIKGDKDGLWIGTDGIGGLHYFDLHQKAFKKFKGQKELQALINHRAVKHISLGDKQQIYLATHGHGLLIYDKSTGQLQGKSQFRIKGKVFSFDQINHVFQDKDAVLWLSTNGHGVLAYNPRTNESTQYHTSMGLLDNIVYGTVSDKNKGMWVISLHGITRLDKEKKLYQIGYRSGFPLVEINPGAFDCDNNANILIGGAEGWVRFNPSIPESPIPSTAIRFTRLKVGDHDVQPGDDTKLLRQSLSKTERIILNHHQRHFMIEFSALSFHTPQQSNYQYKLEGVDQEWVQGKTNQVTFSNLKAGSYVFKVKSASHNAASPGEMAQMQIEILNPPWLTWWAKTLYILLLAGIAIYLWKRYLAGIRLRHKLHLEQVEKEKWKAVHDIKLSYFMDVSHEFRTPLSLILAPLEELMTSENLPEWKRNRLDIMHFNAQRLRQLIDQILQLREIETGQYTLIKQPVHLYNHLNDILMSFRPLATKQQINLVHNLEELGDRYFLIDRDKIEKILFNLLQNAFKFTPPGEEVGLEVRYKDETIQFDVWDTGLGIKEENLIHIFDRFFTKDSPNHGVGIGLSLCKSLAEVMGGHIAVRSKVMEGSRFTVSLPQVRLSDLPETWSEDILLKEDTAFKSDLPANPLNIIPSQVADGSPGETPLKSLLLVDDNEDIKRYLEAQLKPEYTVYLASNGKEGFDMATRYVPDLIISDVVMPEMDGYVFCAAVKNDSTLCHIPVILLTAKNAHTYKIEGLTAGADAYLAKPFHISELKLRIHNMLKSIQLLHERYRAASFVPDVSTLAVQSHDEELLNKINKAILAHIDNAELNVEWLGEKIGLSRVHLFRKMKSLTGMSPSDYIKNFRIKYACQLLLTGKVRIAEVAFLVGFQDSQYFSKVFKKEIGKSPSVFVKDHHHLSPDGHVKKGPLHFGRNNNQL